MLTNSPCKMTTPIGAGRSTCAKAVIASNGLYRTKLCSQFRLGRCCTSTTCTFAHSPEELRQQPSLIRTSMCKNGPDGKPCSEPDSCRYAHTHSELRFTGNLYKTELCSFFFAGACNKGALCRMAHGSHELREREAVIAQCGAW